MRWHRARFRARLPRRARHARVPRRPAVGVSHRGFRSRAARHPVLRGRFAVCPGRAEPAGTGLPRGAHLDGGYKAWCEAGRPVTATWPRRGTGRCRPGLYSSGGCASSVLAPTAGGVARRCTHQAARQISSVGGTARSREGRLASSTIGRARATPRPLRPLPSPRRSGHRNTMAASRLGGWLGQPSQGPEGTPSVPSGSLLPSCCGRAKWSGFCRRRH